MCEPKFFQSNAMKLKLLTGAVLLSCVLPGSAQVSVLTYHNDNARSGQNTNETVLTPSNVKAKFFGKVFTYSVDGFVVGQPLYVPNVNIPGSGTHNVIYVATQHDSVYALDADDSGDGTPLWTTSFIDPGNGINPVPINIQGCGGATGFSEIGIMGTPVIDGVSGTIFVVAKTVENNKFFFRLHALDIGTGIEKTGSPAVITGVIPGLSVFAPKGELQRPALLLNNGTIYISFGSNGCDVGAQGWIMAYNSTTLQQVGVFSAQPEQSWGASMWSGGAGPAGEPGGSIYTSTANGIFDGYLGGLDYGDSVLRLSLVNGDTGGLTLSDYFTPYDQLKLGTNDTDLGSGGVILLPDQPGNFPHLLVTAGKEGTIYVISRDYMGHYNPIDDRQIVQSLRKAVGAMFGSPLYFNQTVYFAAKFDAVKAFSLTDGLLSTKPVAESPDVAALGVPSISANGTDTAVLWLVLGTSQGKGYGMLAAFTAGNLTEVYNTGELPTRDGLGQVAHFVPVTVANGRVYVGTQTQLVAYGLLPENLVITGNNQGGKIGTALPNPLTVQVIDAYTRAPKPNITINFDDGGKNGTFSNPTSTTDSNGMASTNYTLPMQPGRIMITASNPSIAPAYFLESAAKTTAK
jgi:hypothetical protein